MGDDEDKVEKVQPEDGRRLSARDPAILAETARIFREAWARHLAAEAAAAARGGVT
jgi:hypothetical protein